MAANRWVAETAGFQTLPEALQHLSVDDLKRRTRLFESKAPTRKADLVEHLARQLIANPQSAIRNPQTASTPEPAAPRVAVRCPS